MTEQPSYLVRVVNAHGITVTSATYILQESPQTSSSHIWTVGSSQTSPFIAVPSVCVYFWQQ